MHYEKKPINNIEHTIIYIAILTIMQWLQWGAYTSCKHAVGMFSVPASQCNKKLS